MKPRFPIMKYEKKKGVNFEFDTFLKINYIKLNRTFPLTEYEKKKIEATNFENFGKRAFLKTD